MSDDLAEWLRSQVDYDETLAEDDYVEMDEDYEIMVPAGKIRDAAAEITHLRAALATARREGMEGFGDLVAAAHAEATKAMQKYPQPNYIISKIAEEAGEVVKAAIHCAEKRETAENVAGEMKQLIAMLIRLWIEGDQVHGLRPIAAAIRTALEGKKA